MPASTWQIQVGSTWTTIEAPTTWTWSYQDLSSSDSGRDLSGTMHKDIVSVKRKNECTWSNREESTVKTIMQAAKSSAFVQFRYFDLFDGATKTITVYTGDITATAQAALGKLLWTVKLSFIEQ